MSSNTIINHFGLGEVLVTDPYCKNALSKEVKYLTRFDINKLLAGFRDTAGLDTKGYTRYEGWESTLIGGHTVGHYLSAMAQAYGNCGVPQKDKDTIFDMLKELIDGLKECQDHSLSKPGFLCASTILDRDNIEIQFDNVEKGLTNIFTESWVPWYVVHKLLGGLLDVYNMVGYEPALTVAKGIGDWSYNRISAWSPETRRIALGIEYGGINDVLYGLYKATGEDKYAVAAHIFDDEDLFKRICSGAPNTLNDHHANTTIPKFIGALNRYVTCHGQTIDGEKVDATAFLGYAKDFWELVIQKHTYITGANSEWEHFGIDNELDKERTNCNNETCNVHNMLKLSRMLFEITGDIKYFHYYENAYYNSILASQNPETGMSMYFQPMATGYFKTYSTEFTKFWCCTGTGMENFTKLGDSIFFSTEDSIYINLYQSAVLTDAKKDIKLTLNANMPESDKVTIQLSSGAKTSLGVQILLRLPDWLADKAIICVDGTPISYTTVNGYAVIPSEISPNALIEAIFPMKVIAHPLNDNKASIGFKYGPVVLSADLGCDDMTTTTTGMWVTIPAKKVSGKDTVMLPGNTSLDEFIANADKYMVKDDSADKLSFTLTGTNLVFGTHYTRYKERYGIYFYFADSKTLKDLNKLSENDNETVMDTVQPGYGQYECDELHMLLDENSVGSTKVGTTRFAREGGRFTYRMSIDPAKENLLQITLLAQDNGKKLRVSSGEYTLYDDTLNYTGSEDSYNLRINIPAEVISKAFKVTAYEEDHMVIPVCFSGSDSESSARVSCFIYTIAKQD